MSLSDRLAQQKAPHGAVRPQHAVARHAVRQADPFAEVRRSVHDTLLQTLGPRLYDAHLSEGELELRVTDALQTVLDRDQTPMTAADRVRLAQDLADEILGHGPLEPYLRDPEVSEIMVNGHDQVYVERSGRLYPVDASFEDESHLRRTIDKIVARVGRRVDEASPMVDARLPDGSRVNAVVPPLALDGSILTIRKFAADPFTVEDLIRFGTLTAPTAELLRACVRGRLNILISGGTGSGKTSTLNVLSSFVPADERIVTIEDSAELQLQQPHVGRMETRPPNIEGKGEVTQRDLVKNSLRMRPDRIVVGEVRAGEAFDMLQAMNTGHDGSMTTVHANTPRDALSRLEQMIGMAGLDIAPRSIRQQIASAIHVVVQTERSEDGRRRVMSIAEVTGMEGDVISMQEIFRFRRRSRNAAGMLEGDYEATGVRPKFMDMLTARGINLPASMFAPGRVST